MPENVKAQLITVSGYVTHQLTGVTIENASVFESYYRIGTITGKDGYFKLLLKPGPAVLSFSYSGFETTEMKLTLKSDSILSVVLKPFVQGKKPQKKDAISQSGNSELSITETGNRRKYFVF